MLVNPFTRLGKGAGMRTQRAEEALRVRGGEQSRDHPPMQKGFSRPPDRDHVRLISLISFRSGGRNDADPPRSTSYILQGSYPMYGPLICPNSKILVMAA
jgi:hypothetical protein